MRIWSRHAGEQGGGDGKWQCDAVLEEEDHDRTIRSVDWSPDGRCLATASFDASTTVWHQEVRLTLIFSVEVLLNERALFCVCSRATKHDAVVLGGYGTCV